MPIYRTYNLNIEIISHLLITNYQQDIPAISQEVHLRLCQLVGSGIHSVDHPSGCSWWWIPWDRIRKQSPNKSKSKYITCILLDSMMHAIKYTMESYKKYIINLQQIQVV